MGTTDATVRLQALDGTWETCGVDRAIQVDPESLTYTHDEWGAKTAGFTLKRSAISLWPDLGADTPIEIEIGGVLVWDGRISETPIKGSWEVNIQGEGWQAHTDDDVYLRNYVHSKLTDWKDIRSSLAADLSANTSGAQVQTGQGMVSLTWPANTAIGAIGEAAVMLDLGPGCVAERIVFDWSITAQSGGNRAFYIGASNEPASQAPAETTVYSGAGASSGTTAFTFGAPSRYIYIRLDDNSHTPAADETLKITRAIVFGKTAYETGNASIITGDVIGKDALERATLLLSGDFSQIAKPVFIIPDFVLSKASTPREVWEAINAYYNYIAKLLPGRRFSFQPRPTAPQLEIGAWSHADTEDTSANSGAEIYNRALVEATGPDGSPVLVERTSLQQPGSKYLPIASPAPGNPSFATNTATWSTSEGGAFVRNTEASHYRSAPACGQWAPGSPKEILTETFSGTFQKAHAYELRLFVKASAAGAALANVKFGVAGDQALVRPGALSTGEYAEIVVAWSPTANRAGVTLELKTESLAGYFIDDLALLVSEPTLVDRRGFRRTKVIQMSSAITAVEGQQLADIFLQSHMTTPFKGSASINAGAVRRILGGQPVHPSQLGLYTQQLLRLSDHIDPDTGGLGRDGTIAEVSYEHKSQKASVTLDDKRGNFEALLSRLAVVQTPGS